MRKLSTVEKIISVSPVKNSDNLDVVEVRGWTVVTKRGEFKPGDSCVFFEIDSVLPPVELFSFLKPRGYRIKTIKLRGQLSQGLVISLENILNNFHIPDNSLSVGDCLDEHIGVKHADELISEEGGRYFPSFIRKTDQERIQNLNLKKVVNQYYEVSVKLDGSSMTVFYNNGEFGVCSRNRLLPEDDNSKFTLQAKELGLHSVLPQYCLVNNRNLAIQGELIGEGIQGNKEKIDGTEYYVFDIWDIDTQSYLDHKERFKILTDLGLDSVPILFEEPYLVSDQVTKEQLLSMADGPSLNAKYREGLVFKSIDGQFSFKVISNKFLLKVE